ncbi:MAG: Hpt domain-containing protein [Sulfuricellaceae bacterium]
MNIRHRITLLVALTFVAIALIGGFAVIQSRLSAAEVRGVTEGVVPSALASADLVSQLKDVQLAAINLVSARDDGIVEQAKETLSTRKKQLQEGLDLQFKQANSDVQKGLVEQAREGLKDYFAAIDDTAKFKLAGQREMAEANLAANVFVYERELGQVVTTLRTEKSRAKDSAIEVLNQNLSRTAATLSAVTLVAIVVLTAIGILLYRQITLPISRMQAMMTEIASSQDFTRRMPVERQDEIGRSIIAFNTLIAKTHENSVQLKQKTTDIHSMLQNMPQGILTITYGNKVHPEYSAYLETIFETQDIAGRSMMDLVFSDTNLGSDILSQVDAVAGACIGEDAMNFEFNQHLLIGEIEKRMPDGRVKILELLWSPISDDDGNIARLLLCIHDVTELRTLAAEANEKKHELVVIGEILAVSQEKFYEFIDSSTKFLEENERLIHQYPQMNADVITDLFRNMHTVKGNARTYGFKHLTNTVHKAEQTYDELRKKYPDIVWDQATLLEELAVVKTAVERYSKINEVSLGRKGPGRRGNVERFLLVDKKQIQETLQRLETVNTSNIYELLAVRNAVHKVLRLLGTERIAETLAGIFDSLPSLAMELGKVPPIVEIEDNGYLARNQISGMLKNVFMHLIRNSMDHGLETPEERLSRAKPAAGTIRLHMDVANGMQQIKLSDDGRGLALARIRKIAVERGLIAVGDPLSDEEIARQIFRAGFSTAEKVTEVSGRGVGMDAVLNFLKQEKGKVEFRFLDQAVGADFRQFETVVCLPENFFVQVDASESHLVGKFVTESSGENGQAPGESGKLRSVA